MFFQTITNSFTITKNIQINFFKLANFRFFTFNQSMMDSICKLTNQLASLLLTENDELDFEPLTTEITELIQPKEEGAFCEFLLDSFIYV